MANTITAQSATRISASSVTPENWDFVASAKRAASRQTKNNTKERFMLKRQNLVSSCCSEFRDNFPQLFEKRDDKGNLVAASMRVPPEYFTKVEEAVDKLIAEQQAFITNENIVSFVRRNVHVASKQIYVQRLISTGENHIDWQEQLLSCHIDIRETKRRMEDADKQGKLTDELQVSLNKRLENLYKTEEHIKANMPKVTEPKA